MNRPESELRSRCQKVRDGMHGAVLHYPHSGAFLYSLADYIALYYGQPIVSTLRMRRPDGTWSKAFTTLGPNDRLFYRWEPVTDEPTSEHDDTAGSHQMTLEFGGYKIVVSICSRDHKSRLKYPAKYLEVMLNDSHLSDAVMPSLIEAMDASQGNKAAAEPAEGSTREQLALPVSKVRDLLEPLRRRLSRVLWDLRDSKLLRPPDNVDMGADDGLTNLFAVVRYFDGTSRDYVTTGSGQCVYPYTASILLADDQAQVLNALWRSSSTREQCDYQNTVSALRSLSSGDLVDQLGVLPPNPEDDISYYLQLPLRSGSRSIADSVFESGTLDIGFNELSSDLGRDDIGGHPFDAARRAAEDFIYPLSGLTPKNYQMIYVPVHVGGVVWLALYRFGNDQTRSDKNVLWEDNYHFYRDVVPQVASDIRQIAQEAFEEAVTRELTDALQMRNIGSLANEVVRRWRDIAAVYPYPLIELERAKDNEDSSDCINLRQYGLYRLKLSPNPLFPSPIDFRPLDVKSLRNACRAAADVALGAQDAERLRSAVLRSSVLHELKNDLPKITASIENQEYDLAAEQARYLGVVANAFYNLNTETKSPEFAYYPSVLSRSVDSCCARARLMEDHYLKDYFGSISNASAVLREALHTALVDNGDDPVSRLSELPLEAKGLYIAVTNLLYDAWRNCGAVWNPEKNHIERDKERAFISLELRASPYEAVVIRTGALLSDRTYQESFTEESDGTPRGFVGAGQDAGAARTQQFLRGSQLAQSMAKMIGLHISIHRIAETGGSLICCGKET